MVGEEPLERPGSDHRARQEVRPRLLTLLDHCERHVAQPLGNSRVLLEQLPEPDRARQPRGPGAHHEHADLDALVDGVGRFDDVPVRIERRLEVDRTRHQPACLRSNSMSSGTTVWTSPTTARSLNSKIGACGSLFTATIVFEFCIPTLCCTAPEIPSAT